MFIAFIVVVGIFLLAMFFLLAVHPFVCIAECAMSKHLSGSQKVMWILLTFFLGFFGSFAYALVGTQSARLRSITLKGTGFCVMLGMLTAALAFTVPSSTSALQTATEGEQADFFSALEGTEAMAGIEEALKDSMEQLSQQVSADDQSNEDDSNDEISQPSYLTSTSSHQSAPELDNADQLAESFFGDDMSELVDAAHTSEPGPTAGAVEQATTDAASVLAPERPDRETATNRYVHREAIPVPTQPKVVNRPAEC